MSLTRERILDIIKLTRLRYAGSDLGLETIEAYELALYGLAAKEAGLVEALEKSNEDYKLAGYTDDCRLPDTLAKFKELMGDGE